MRSCGWTGIRDDVSGMIVLCTSVFCTEYIQTLQNTNGSVNVILYRGCGSRDEAEGQEGLVANVEKMAWLPGSRAHPRMYWDGLGHSQAPTHRSAFFLFFWGLKSQVMALDCLAESDEKRLGSKLRKQGGLNVKLPCGVCCSVRGEWRVAGGEWRVESGEWRTGSGDPHTEKWVAASSRAKTSSHQLRRWRLACGPLTIPSLPQANSKKRGVFTIRQHPPHVCLAPSRTNPCHTFGSGFPAPDLHMLDDERRFSGRLVMAQN